MSNVIQIKHGTTAPADGILQPYELGYADNGYLYIGGIPTEEVPSAPAIQLSDANLFKYITIDNENQQIKISSHCFTFNPMYVFPSSTTLQNLASLRGIGGGFQIETVSAEKLITDFKLFATDGALIVGENNYGTENPNDAGIAGVAGQLYFVLAE